MTSRSRPAAALLAATALLGACSGGGGEAAPAPTGAATSATTASPSPSGVQPSATPTSVATAEHEAPVFTPSTEFTQGDAIGFAAFYVNVINHVRITGDPALLREYSLPECDTCAYIIQATDDFRTKGIRYVNPELQFHELNVNHWDPQASRAEVVVSVSGDLGQLVRPDGSLMYEPEPLDHQSVYVQMVLRDGRWRFEEVL